MSWLSKKDICTFICYIIVSIVISCFIRPFVKINSEKIIEFFSIATGFLTTAVSLIYASNIRNVLYNAKSNGYPSSWHESLTHYRFSILYFIFLVFVYSVKISVIPGVIYNIIYLTALFGGSYWLIKIFNSLFYLLGAEINGE